MSSSGPPVPRALVAAAFGGPETIEVIDVPRREPRRGEVLVRIRAAALNPWDARIAAGALGLDPASLPLRMGIEAAGEVIAAGDEAVSADGVRVKSGDEVVGSGLTGALASEITAPAECFVMRPASLSAEEAAGLLLAGGVAIHALGAVGLRQGQTLLVHGVAGGVGSMIAQLARLQNADVVGTAAATRHARLLRAGVRPVEYGPGLLERVRVQAPSGIDAAIDTIGTAEAIEVSLALLDDPTRFATIVNFSAAIAAGGKALGHAPGADPGDAVRSGAMVRLVQLARQKVLAPSVAAVFPLMRGREAFELLEKGHAGGKIVLVP
jgi:NADPH:quinone reductase